MDQLTNLQESSLMLLPWGTFVLGMMGSAHCVGMCGGLVTACSKGPKTNFLYQVGRLIGYAALGIAGGFIGQSLNLKSLPKWVALIPAISIGLLFVFAGIKAFRNQKLDFKLPSFLNKLQGNLFKSAFKVQSSELKTFSIGLLSLLLPCGLLYGVVFAVAAFQNPLVGMFSMMTFWLGTVPAMSLAPHIVQKLIKPLYKFSPKIMSLSLVAVGMATIIIRVVSIYGQQATHSCH